MDARKLAITIQILLIAGAINWGIIALTDKDAVQQVAGGPGAFDKLIKLAVGAAGAYSAYQMYVVYSS